MKTVSIWGDSVLKGIILDNESLKYSIFKDNSIDQVSRKTGLNFKNNSKFGMTVLKAFDLLKKSILRTPASDFTVVELGGNDSDFDWQAISENPLAEHNPKTPLPVFIDCIIEMIRFLKNNGTIPILTNLTPIDSQKYFDWFTRDGLSKQNILSWLGEINRIYHYQECYSVALMEIAKRENCDIIDIRTPMIYSKDFPNLMCKDGIHPNELGHKVIADTLVSFIKKKQHESNYKTA